MQHFRNILAALLLLPCAALAQVAYRWQVDTARPAPADWPVFRGETVTLEPAFGTYGAYLGLEGTTATLYWQTNGMASAWWSAPAAIATGSPDRVRAVWTPEMDSGASAYRYFVGVSGPGTTGTTYRAHGTIRYSHAPGATPNALPLPVSAIDFGTVTVSNAPWSTPADLAATLALAEVFATVRAEQAQSNALDAVDAVSLAGLAAKDDRAASLQVVSHLVTNGVQLAAASLDYNGDYPVGTIWYPTGSPTTVWTNAGPHYVVTTDNVMLEPWMLTDGVGGTPQWMTINASPFQLPATLDETVFGAAGSITLDWAISTNYASVASVPFVESLLPTWPSRDIVTGKSFSIVVSNEHWLIIYPPETP